VQLSVAKSTYWQKIKMHLASKSDVRRLLKKIPVLSNTAE